MPRLRIDRMTPAPVHGLLRQGLFYGLFGLAQLLADWLCFVALTSLGLAVVPANVMGRVAGAVLGYWLNGRVTFARRGGSPALGPLPLLKFIASWLIAAALSTFGVWALDKSFGLQGAWLGKLALDGMLAGIGFMLSKYWIYR
jgi:putative flippase GtrA